VRFVRALLGEPQSDFPYAHPMITVKLEVCSIPVAMNGIIFGGLGCAAGCDFCATSHYFKRQHIRLLPEPQDLLNIIRRYREKFPGIGFTVFDEDFLRNEAWARRFLELLRKSGDQPPAMFVLTSISALSKFTAEELVEMGISMAWIGYEGKRSGYAKQQGTAPAELFRELRQHGILVLASYIMGFDYQTKEIIRQEIDELLAMKCTYHQFSIYGPTPGTPYFDRVMKEDRLLAKYKADPFEFYRRCTAFYALVAHPSIAPDEMEALQAECYQREFDVLGPSLIRTAETRLLGYKTLVNHSNPTCRKVAEVYRNELEQFLPIFLTASLFGPNPEARSHAREVLADVKAALGLDLGAAHRAKSLAFLGAALWTDLCLKRKWFQQPLMTRTVYNH
jgi:radical SAM superfamily enzyme YgiQ (UPF0313 family)